uniref:Uncharacterized protein n=1 Tax=viral metagenome TaxID=1070528 RepID=A0A6M3JK43_9ZZZZ
MESTQHSTAKENTKSQAIKCNCQPKKGQGVLRGCQNCTDGNVCSDMYEALLTALGTITALDNGKEWVKDTSDIIQKALAKAGGEITDDRPGTARITGTEQG